MNQNKFIFTLSSIANEENIQKIITQKLAESTQELFLNMFSQEVTLGTPEISNEYGKEYLISGVMSIFQEKLEGYLLLSFDRESVLKLFSVFYESEFNTVSELVIQGVSEMTNILFGSFKKIFIERGYDFKSELPNFIYGPEHFKNFYFDNFSKLTYPVILNDYNISLNIFYREKSEDSQDEHFNLDAIWRI